MLKFAQQISILLLEMVHVSNPALWNGKRVVVTHWSDVAKAQDVIGFMENGSREFPTQDGSEDCRVVSIALTVMVDGASAWRLGIG